MYYLNYAYFNIIIFLYLFNFFVFMLYVSVFFRGGYCILPDNINKNVILYFYFVLSGLPTSIIFFLKNISISFLLYSSSEVLTLLLLVLNTFLVFFYLSFFKSFFLKKFSKNTKCYNTVSNKITYYFFVLLIFNFYINIYLYYILYII